MYCKECGREFSEDTNFCPYCGAQIKEVKKTCPKCGFELEGDEVFCPNCGEVLANEILNKEKELVNLKPSKAWNVFAKLGFGLGLAGLITSIIFIGIELTVPAIVFSALGMKSYEFKGKAKAGLVMSIIGTVLSIVVIYVFYFIIGYYAAAGGTTSGGGNYGTYTSF